MSFDTARITITGSDPVAQKTRTWLQQAILLRAVTQDLIGMYSAMGIDGRLLLDPATGSLRDRTNPDGTQDAPFAALAAILKDGSTAGQGKLVAGLVTQVGGFYALADPVKLGAVTQ